MNLRTYITHLFHALFLAASLVLPAFALAGPLTLSTVPLDVQEGVAPNVYLTFDDSGSMAWSFMPDSVYFNNSPISNLNAFEASTYNKIYYNPALVYIPAVDENDTPYPNASFTGAWVDGFKQSAGTVDLSKDYRVTVAPGYNILANQAAFYYVYTGTGNPATDTNNASYTKYIVGSASDKTPGTPVQQEQNFANWYSYYRTRVLMAKTAISLSFGSLGSGIRVAGQNINNDTLDPNTPSGVQMLHPFSGTNRSNWFAWLDAITPGGGTPLRESLKHVGQYYGKSGLDSPYAKTPGVQDTPEYSCRQNFSMLMTDGMWNGNNPNVGNADGTNGPSITDTQGKTYQYTPTAPYKDSWSNTLADVAMYYWDHDLRTNLANNVPPYLPYPHYTQPNGTVIDQSATFYDHRNDPADWQHMVTFTIGLGVNGTLDPSTDLPALTSGAKSWPQPVPGTISTIDDLWHASINGRGDYVSASNPQQLVATFRSMLNNLTSRSGSATGPAASLPVYQSGTLLYQPFYDTSDWSGNIEAKDIISLAQVWDTQTRLAAQLAGQGPARNIITFNPTTQTGIPFTWSSLPSTLKSDLNTNAAGVVDNLGAKRVNFLRGDFSYEQKNGGTFRNRTTALGDIVDSTPLYVGPPDRIYPDALEPAPYSAFRTLYKNRTPVLYVGANDGLLHAFNAKTGYELFAYAPAILFPELSQLTDPAYAHHFYVDGSPSEGDAYFNSSWHSVLVGGLDGGGQGIYALDVTNPAGFSEANAANMVLWEFTDVNHPDLGDTFSQPQIVRMNNGEWVAIFGNGYNNTVADGHASTTGDAVLYVVDIGTGALIAKLDTGVGSSQDPLGLNRPNGLATVTPVDIDGNHTVDYIYAGDLFGNLWKFDMTSTNPAKWTVVSKGNVPTPLFVAKDALGNRQPITTAPVVNFHPTRPGLLIGFGTGKYLEMSDLTDTSQQTMYVVWDRMESTITTINRSVLKQQQVLATNSSQFGPVNARVTTNYNFQWYLGAGLPSGVSQYLGWYINLPDAGERLIYTPILRAGRLIFNTVVPNNDPCQAGGYSWLNELDFATGKRLSFSPFDYNGDGVFNGADLVNVTGQSAVVGSSMRNTTESKTGNYFIMKLPGSSGTEMKISTDTRGQVVKVLEQGSPGTEGRRSWYQFIFN